MNGAAETGVATQIAIALARTFWKLLAVVVAFSVLVGTAVVARAPEPEYEASALVVANQLAIRPEGLPRLAEAVFQGGAVAERATTGQGALPFQASELIPERARLEPFENTVIMAVVGNSDDPQLAAAIANRVATEFVGELAKSGPGVGVFSVQDTARPPAAPLPRPGAPEGVAVGFVAGVTLAAGLLALWLVTRRPVLTPGEAARAAESRIIAVLVLDRARRGSRAWGEPAPGAAAVARQLFPDLAGMAAVLAPAGAAAERARVAMMVARVLSHSSTVHLVTTAQDTPPPAALDGQGQVVIATEVPSGRVWAVSPVLIDGPSEYDLPLLTPPNGRLALVVAEGVPKAEVERLAAQFLPGDLLGVVFTRPNRSMRRRLRRAARLPRPPGLTKATRDGDAARAP